MVLCAVLVALQGCAGDGPGSCGGTSEFDVLQCDVFNVSCVSGACHNSQTQAGSLDLSPGSSYGQLVGVTPDNAVARADGMLRVQPFAPGNSFLLRKVTNPTAGEGSRMPLGADPLSAAQIELIRNWIASGATAGTAATPTRSATAVPTETTVPTATATETALPTGTATPTETLVPTSTSTATPVPPTVTGTVPPSATPSETATPSPTPTRTPTATTTATPTETPTSAPTATFTIAPGSTLAEIQTDIFTPRCAVSGCHTDDLAPFNGDLSLQLGSSYAALVGVDPQNAAAQQRGLLRVDPGDPGNSFLMNKITVPGPGEGSPMPLIGARLTAAQIEDIRAWIVRGALPDETPPEGP